MKNFQSMMLWCVACITLLPAVSAAEMLCPPPTSRVVLTLQPANGPAIRCDLPALERLPQKTLETRLPAPLGLEGRHRWSGVSLGYFAKALGADRQSQVHLVALNHYAVSVPMSDLERFDPVLAMRINGERISVREKGPLILIYPFDQYRELAAQDYLNRSIWQVNEIRIK